MDAIQWEAGDWISGTKAEGWTRQPDTYVIGQRFSPACYIAESMPASLYLVWKYHDEADAISSETHTYEKKSPLDWAVSRFILVLDEGNVSALLCYGFRDLCREPGLLLCFFP